MSRPRTGRRSLYTTVDPETDDQELLTTVLSRQCDFPIEKPPKSFEPVLQAISEMIGRDWRDRRVEVRLAAIDLARSLTTLEDAVNAAVQESTDSSPSIDLLQKVVLWAFKSGKLSEQLVMLRNGFGRPTLSKDTKERHATLRREVLELLSKRKSMVKKKMTAAESKALIGSVQSSVAEKYDVDLRTVQRAMKPASDKSSRLSQKLAKGS